MNKQIMYAGAIIKTSKKCILFTLHDDKIPYDGLVLKHSKYYNTMEYDSVCIVKVTFKDGTSPIKYEDVYNNVRGNSNKDFKDMDIEYIKHVENNSDYKHTIHFQEVVTFSTGVNLEEIMEKDEFFEILSSAFLKSGLPI